MDPEPGGNDHAADDFIIVDDAQNLPFRTRPTVDQGSQPVELHPLTSKDSFIVSVQPPNIPKDGLKRASCDIVLVIDVSGSMAAAAPLPDTDDKDEKEAAGLSVLDLTKHAARTVLETLGKEDRLGIVTFSDNAMGRYPL